MDEIIKNAIEKAERMNLDTRTGWAFGNLREEVDALHNVLIAHVVRTPSRGFDGWMYYEKDPVLVQASLKQLEAVLVACLEMLRLLRKLE